MVNFQCRKIYLKNMALHNFDGRYIDSQRDITLKWRGSSNQRVIDVQKSLKRNEVILYEN